MFNTNLTLSWFRRQRTAHAVSADYNSIADRICKCQAHLYADILNELLYEDTMHEYGQFVKDMRIIWEDAQDGSVDRYVEVLDAKANAMKFLADLEQTLDIVTDTCRTMAKLIDVNADRITYQEEVDRFTLNIPLFQENFYINRNGSGVNKKYDVFTKYELKILAHKISKMYDHMVTDDKARRKLEIHRELLSCLREQGQHAAAMSETEVTEDNRSKRKSQVIDKAIPAATEPEPEDPYNTVSPDSPEPVHVDPPANWLDKTTTTVPDGIPNTPIDARMYETE